jgi:hypothetical protein
VHGKSRIKLPLTAEAFLSTTKSDGMWDFPLFIDEVQTCTSPALARGLSELRKFRIPLLGAHQFTRALPSEVLDAVKGNVGTMIVFRIGADDADVLANEFMPELGVNKDSCKIPADHS